MSLAGSEWQNSVPVLQRYNIALACGVLETFAIVGFRMWRDGPGEKVSNQLRVARVEVGDDERVDVAAGRKQLRARACSGRGHGDKKNRPGSMLLQPRTEERSTLGVF